MQEFIWTHHIYIYIYVKDSTAVEKPINETFVITERNRAQAAL